MTREEENNYPRTPDPEAALDVSTSQVDLRSKALLSSSFGTAINNSCNTESLEGGGGTSSGAHSRAAAAVSHSGESATPSKNKSKNQNNSACPDFIPLTHPPPPSMSDKDNTNNRPNNAAKVSLPRLMHP